MTDSRFVHRTFLAVALLAGILCAPSAPAAEAPDACAGQDPAANKRVARIVFEEILSQGRIDENEGIYHQEFTARGLRRDATRAEDRAAAKGWREAVPDLKMVPLAVVAECDFVAVHWEGTGTNSGEGNGLPATGKSLRLRGMTFFRFEKGRIREEWTSFDNYELLRQTGLLAGSTAR